MKRRFKAILFLVLSCIFFILFIFSEYKIVTCSLWVFFVLFTSYIYFELTKKKNVKKAKDKRIAMLKEEKAVCYSPKLPYYGEDTDFEEQMPFNLLSIIYDKGLFECFALYLENENCIQLRVEYNFDKKGDDVFYFTNFNTFFKYFDLV